MQLVHLDLRQFRSYERLSLDLPAGMVVLHGANGAGKTSLLEAICLAAFGDSPRASTLAEMVRTGADHAFVRCDFAGAAGKSRVEMGVARTGQRQFKIAGAVRRRADLIGLAPVVLFWADDIDVVRGEPSGRRRLLDLELGSVSKSYYFHLTRYRRALEQRNRLLKFIRERTERPDALDPWDRALARHGAHLMVERADFAAALAPHATVAHARLTGIDRPFLLEYRPSVAPAEQGAEVSEKNMTGRVEATVQAMLQALAGQRRLDLLSGATASGPHRDELSLLLGEQPVRVYGSQGEVRSCAIALRLGLAEVVRRMTGESPLLLLDDVLSELDERHRQGVFAACGEADQVIVTCCDAADIPAEVRTSAALYEVAHGTVG